MSEANSALDRLSSLVNNIVGKNQGGRMLDEASKIGERLRSSVILVERDTAEYEVRKRRIRELTGTIERDTKVFESLVKEAAKLRFTMGVSEIKGMEALISEADSEIKKQKQEVADLSSASIRGYSDLIDTLVKDCADYRRIRSAIRKLVVVDASPLVRFDRLYDLYSHHDPIRCLDSLREEIVDSRTRYGGLSTQEQYLRMSIWIGRYRLLQEMIEDGDSEDASRAKNTINETFGLMTEMSKQHQPGYIEAFQLHFRTNWEDFIHDKWHDLGVLLNRPR